MIQLLLAILTSLLAQGRTDLGHPGQPPRYHNHNTQIIHTNIPDETLERISKWYCSNQQNGEIPEDVKYAIEAASMPGDPPHLLIDQVKAHKSCRIQLAAKGKSELVKKFLEWLFKAKKTVKKGKQKAKIERLLGKDIKVNPDLAKSLKKALEKGGGQIDKICKGDRCSDFNISVKVVTGKNGKNWTEFTIPELQKWPPPFLDAKNKKHRNTILQVVAKTIAHAAKKAGKKHIRIKAQDVRNPKLSEKLPEWGFTKTPNSPRNFELKLDLSKFPLD